MTGPAPVRGRTQGRVIHTGQGVVDLVLRIPAVPEPGGDVYASQHEFLAGGGVNVMAAAARDGAEVVYAGSHGTGPFGDLVREALHAEGVQVLSPPDPTADTGFSIALVDDTAERTFVSTAGAEARTGIDMLRLAAPQPGDVVYVSGYSLVHDVNREALREWIPSLPEGCVVVVDPSPVIVDVDLDAVHALLDRADVWTTNEREARILCERLMPGSGDVGRQPGLDALATELAVQTNRTILLRAGERGALLARPGGSVLTVPAPRVAAIDTNGAGDAHTGVLCAQLADGQPLERAVTRAGVAAALAVTRRGPASGPTSAEIDAAMNGL